MGCGVSKFNKDEIGPMYLYYNPLHRRTDDLGPWQKKGYQATSIDLASAKQLPVEEADSIAGSGSNFHGRNSVSAGPEKATGDPSHVDECVVKLPPVAQQMVKARGGSGVNGEEVNTIGAAEGNNATGNGGGKEVAVAAIVEGEEGRGSSHRDGNDGGSERHEPNSNDGSNERKEDQEDYESRLRDKENSIFYPGSPSFREYCFSSNYTSADADADGNDNSITDDDIHGEPGLDHLRKDSFAFEPEKEDTSPSVDPVELEKKSRRRSRRFRVGLRRNSSAGMRSLWHVASCSPHRPAGKAAS